jgi:hypothetical protein
MAGQLDVCRFVPTAGGTTDFTYSSAVQGYQSPTAAGVVNGRLYKYRAESADLTQWEVGEGAYNTATGVLARTTVLFNSSGTTSKISFSAAPTVGIVLLKEDLILVDEANSFTAGQQLQARNNIGAGTVTSVANGYGISGGTITGSGTLAASLTSSSSALGADVTLTSSSTPSDGPSLSLAAGTWLVIAYATVQCTGNTQVFARLWDGTTTFASTGFTLTGGSFLDYTNICMSAIVTPGSTTTYKISATSSSASAAKFRASASSLAKDTQIVAIRIA